MRAVDSISPKVPLQKISTEDHFRDVTKMVSLGSDDNQFVVKRSQGVNEMGDAKCSAVPNELDAAEGNLSITT